MTEIFVGDRPIDLPKLNAELGDLAPEGVQVRDGYLYQNGPTLPPEELPPEAVPIVEAHDGTTTARAAAFESAEDAERLRLVNERARDDAAFAALADLTLGKQGVQT